jgi:hypothetical protein
MEFEGMTRGRNTSVVAVRMSDKSIEILKEKASQKAMGYTVLARHLILKGIGLKEELPVDIESETRKAIQSLPNFSGPEKGRLKRKNKGKQKHRR